MTTTRKHTSPLPARTPLLLAIGLALAAGPALAQTPDDPDAETSATRLDAVIVTGTRVADRTIAESLSPIDVVGIEALQDQASPELNVALSKLVPSFNFPRPSITDGTDHVRPAQLRGLAPDQTLVLVNGKRRHTTSIVNVNGSLGRGSSPVDLNTIPASAIERIEVLRDGAAAQYGSDAIAGVINIVLKGRDSGSGVDARYGEFKEGDGELVNIGAYTSLDMGPGFLSLAAEFRDRGPTNRAGLDPRQFYPSQPDGSPDPREATANRRNFRFGDADVQDTLVFFNGGADLSDSVEVYVFGSYGQRDGESAGFYRLPGATNNVPEVYPDGFLPLIGSDQQDRSLVGGLRGTTAGGWRWDASVTTGGNDFTFDIRNSINVAIGPTSPTQFFAGALANDQTVVNLDFSRGFDLGLAYPVNLAFGAEHRREGYRIRAGEAASFFFNPDTPTRPGGSQVFPGFRPSDEVDVDRDSWAAYVDVEADLTDRLLASAALRHEDYSDFGDTTSGKLSARFAFTDRLALRGTYSTGFRAPSLAQQFYSTTSTVFINPGTGTQPFEVRTFPVFDPVGQLLGAEALRAEESTNVSIGLSAGLGDGWTLTADAYQIEIDDRIVLSENLTSPAVRSFLTANGFPGVSGGRYFTNAVDTRTRGFDVVLAGGFDAGPGRLATTLALNYNETDVTRVAANPASLQAVDPNAVRIGRAEIGRITEGSPKDKVILGLDYDLRNWILRLGATRYGEFTTFNASNPALDQTYGAKVVVDASVTWRATEQLRLTLGADNVNDAYPDRVRDNGGAFDVILPYSQNSPFGFNGAFYYGRVSYTF